MTRPRFDLPRRKKAKKELPFFSVCLSAANLRRFSSADSATGGADFKRPSKRKLSEKLTEGVRLLFYTNKQCFESQRCDLLLPSAFGSHLPLRGRSYFFYHRNLIKNFRFIAQTEKAPKRAPSSRAWSLPPAVREAGKRNAEGLSAKLTEGVWRAQNMLLTQMLIFTK